MNNSITDNSINWITGSDIRIKDPTSQFNGAFYSSYDSRKHLYHLLYCEITGYGIKFLLNLYVQEKNKKYLDMALSSGQFLLKSQNNEINSPFYGAFPYGYDRKSFKKIGAYFSFDTSIIMSSLIDLYKKTADIQYLNSAKRAGEWLVNFMQNEDGSFKAVLFDNNFINIDNRLRNFIGSINKSCLHAKNAIGLIKLSEASNIEHFKTSAIKTLHWPLKLQNSDGGFRITENKNFIFSHFHCYCLEGLLYGYFKLRNNMFLESSIKGAEWLLKNQNEDGSLFKSYGFKPGTYVDNEIRYKIGKLFLRPRDVGVTSQAIRIWLILFEYTNNLEFKMAAEKAKKFLESMQNKSRKNFNSSGAFHFNCFKLPGFTMRSAHLSTWTTMFACRALQLTSEKDIKETTFFSNFF